MEDLEQPALPDSAADTTATPDPGDAVETTEVSTETDLTPEEQAAQQAIEDEIEEELEGVKLRGKKDAVERIKAERLMQADYTRKTQTAAEEKRTAEAIKAQYQQATQLQQHFAQELGELQVIDKQLAQFQNLDLRQLADTDPVQALKLHTTFTQLQAQRGQLWDGITQKDRQLKAFNESEDSKRANAAEAIVAREIKDWGPEKYRQLQEFAQAKGVLPDRLRAMLVNVPESASFLADAMKWRQLEQARAKKPPVAPAPPVTRLNGATAASTKDPAQMSDREFAEWRKRQIAQRK